MLQELTVADVQSHNTKDDLHFIIKGQVYNATEFVDEHPGGPELLLDVAGQDATEAYRDAGHSEEADDILQDFLIGTVKAGEAPEPIPEPQVVEHLIQPTEDTITRVLKPDEFQEFELQEKTIVSHNVAIYRFKLPTAESIFGLPIGQHISIGAVLAQSDGTSKEIVRSYTPISGDHQPGYFDLLVKAYPQGNITQHIAGLEIGQHIRVRGPKGNFTYTPNMVRHFGMIAGGSGITPMLQIVRAIMRGRANGDKTEVDLIFANVNHDDILLKEDLDALNKEDPGVRVHYVLNNPPEGWTGGVGFVTPEMLSEWMPKPADDVKILLCGPPPMVSAMKKATETLGYEKAKPISKLEDQVFAF